MSIVPSKFILPRLCSRHREAAIALYRALITSSRNVPGLNSVQCQQLQNVIRHRFKENRYNHSERWLRLRFVAGYQGLDVLDAAQGGDCTKNDFIQQLLERTPLRTKQAPSPANAYPLEIRRRIAKEARAAKFEKADTDGAAKKPSIFDRPLPLSKLSGSRHVPYLISANKIPMLRIGKPMPQSLAGYIARRIKARQKRIDSREVFAAQRVIASFEDQWDTLVGLELPKKVKEQTLSRSWQQAIILADQRDQVLHKKESKQLRTVAEKMQNIVDQEAKLYKQEQKDKEEKRSR